jgi:hypothetical protein
MPGRGGQVFDPMGAVEVLSMLVMDNLLDPTRAHRLCTQTVYDSRLPTLRQVLRNVTAQVLSFDQASSACTGLNVNISSSSLNWDTFLLVQVTAQAAWVDGLARLYADMDSSTLVCAIVGAELDYIGATLQSASVPVGSEVASYIAYIASRAAARSTVIHARLSIPLGPPI